MLKTGIGNMFKMTEKENGLSDESRKIPQDQRAAQYSSETNSICVNRIPIPVPTKDQLLIKVASASLCHSDLMHFEPNEAGIILGDGRPVNITKMLVGSGICKQRVF